MDESPIYYAKYKKPASKGCLPYDSIHVAFWKSQNHMHGEQIRGCQGLGLEERIQLQRGSLCSLLEVMDLCHVLLCR